MAEKPTYEELAQRVRELEQVESERKKATEALRESKEKYHHLSTMMHLMCDNVPDMIWAKDLEKRFIFANRAICRDLLNATDTNEPLGKTDMFFSEREQERHPEDPDWHSFGELCRGSDQVTMDAGTPQQFDEFGNVKGNFLFLDVHKAPFLNERGMMIGTVGSARDVTKRKLAEETIKNTSELLSLFIKHSPIYAFLKEVSQKESYVLYASDNYSDMVGIPASQMIGKPMGELFPTEFAEKITQDDIDVVVKGENLKIDEDLNGRNYVTYKFPIIQGEKKYLAGYTVDITERKRAEKALRQIEKAESLNRMAGAVAHRFNNQLSVVIGNLQLALEDLPADSPQRKNNSRALKAALRSAETSGLMLTYLGQITVKGEPIDLSDVCRRNLPSTQELITERIAVETHLMDAGPIIRACTSQVQQILTYLITNAVEAIGKNNGKIMFSTGTVQTDNILDTNLSPPDWKPADDNYACLEVTDSGCGIAKKDLDRVFDPFFSTKFTGRGLGLAVIQGIVRQWNGALNVESVKGKGTTFRVFFPMIDDAMPLLPKEATIVPPMQGSKGILLVEDEDMVRDMAEQTLKHLGYSVIASSGGTEALELFNRHHDEIDCVITDLSMPDMDGWETIAALRQVERNIQIILVSGYDEVDVMSGGQSERPQVFLHKPYKKADLKAALTAIGK